METVLREVQSDGHARHRQGPGHDPKKLRDYLGIKPGTAVELRLNPRGEVVLSRADGKRPRSKLAKLYGIARGGMTTDEIMALTRGDD
jgi:bifunctional DNA-binding transcriptional regulator/antitoxin component of YhaV-PrlF toxin-antitoxin module